MGQVGAPATAGPIVFISHARVLDGQLDEVRRLLGAGTPQLMAAKPGTVLFLAYLTDDGERLRIVHAVADPDAFDRHLEGVAERSARWAGVTQTEAFEVFGTLSEAGMSFMRRAAEASGATLTTSPTFVAGYLRLVDGNQAATPARAVGWPSRPTGS